MEENQSANYYKQSRFSHLFSREKESLLVHSVIMRPLSIDSESLSIFEKFKKEAKISEIIRNAPESEGLIKHLISERLIIGSQVDETRMLKEWVENIANPQGLIIAYLLPTDQCNLRCKYCFIENEFKSSHKFTFMTESTAKKGIDFFVENISKKEGIEPKLIFYGGEPLLNAEVVVSSIKYIKKEYPFINMNMVTNGSLMTKDLAKILAEHNVGVSISLDGPKEIHDKIRPSLNGNGTYDAAVRGYNMLKDANCKNVGISLTLTSQNLPDLEENIRKIYDELKPNGFGFNFLIDTCSGPNPFSMPMEYTTKKAIEAFKFLREKGVYEDRMMRKIKPFIKGSLHLKDCGAPGNQIVIAPNGDIGPCQGFLSSKKYFTQNIHRSPILEGDVSFEEWKKRYPANIEECLDCEALGICGGGCPYNSYVNYGTIWALDRRMCEHNKLFMNWLLWDVYDAKMSKE